MPFDRDREREMFTATCGDCGNECQIPFKPKDDRPVYCRECFQNHKPPQRSGGSRYGRGSSYSYGRNDRGSRFSRGSRDVTDQEKCLPQPVVTVEMNVKYHSSQKMIDLFIAKNVSKIINKISKLFSVTLKTPQFY